MWKRAILWCAWSALALCGCGSSEEPEGQGGSSGSAGNAGSAGAAGTAADAGPALDAANEAAAPDAAPDARQVLEAYLLGDFDNAAQFDAGFGKLVERHVCLVPGRDDPSVLWLYAEHVEVLSSGERDSYFTRVNELRMVGDTVVSRAYKFATDHPLYSNAYAFNGPIDGCTQPAVLEAITEGDLVYRDGCDVTFVQDGELFHATSQEGTCTFPGGYITTTAEVFADGMDVKDEAYQGGGAPVGETFEFRRVLDWAPPGA